MFVISILDSPVLHLVAETMAIVIGSMLLGILLAYLQWYGYKRKSAELTNKLDFEKNQVYVLNAQLQDVTLIRDHLAEELQTEKIKNSNNAKSIYDLQQRIYQLESQMQQDRSASEKLLHEIEAYRERLRIIEEELEQPEEMAEPSFQHTNGTVLRANYDHVSRLLGRQVIENDLTVIHGIGPRTASLLQAMGIDTSALLAETQVDRLRHILTEAGGVYKSQDPTYWPKQAYMAAQSEWRKLRVFQETLKNVE